MKDNILIFGHKSPDTDSVCSAIAYSNLKKELGIDTKPIRLGELSKETEFILDFFNIEKPELLTEIKEKAEKQEVILVDHNERTQTIDGIENAKIIEIIDHHKFGNFETAEPLFIKAEPVGCTSTLIYDLYKENDIVPSKVNAGLMLSAILSDTLIFKSPTCTEKDKKAVKALAAIAGLDYEKYGMEMLIAGTSLSDKSSLDVITMDMKEFTMGRFKTAIGQVNTVDIPGLLGKKAELEKEINNLISKNNYNLFLLVITDIVNAGSKILALGDSTNLVELAFETELEDNLAWLPGVVSRKKQVVPFLMKAQENL